MFPLGGEGVVVAFSILREGGVLAVRPETAQRPFPLVFPIPPYTIGGSAVRGLAKSLRLNGAHAKI